MMKSEVQKALHSKIVWTKLPDRVWCMALINSSLDIPDTVRALKTDTGDPKSTPSRFSKVGKAQTMITAQTNGTGVLTLLMEV